MKTLKLVTAALLATLGTAAVAEYPDKPVSFVIPFPPGDLEDVLTRMIAEDFQNEYGVAAAVVNRPSDGGPFPGAAEVAMAPADGYTIGSFVVGVPVVGPNVGIPALNPDPFDPLGIFLTYPFVIATSADAPYSSLEELAAQHSMRFTAPPMKLCTDNAAMIAWAGCERLALDPDFPGDPLDIKARPRWPLDPEAEAVRGAGVKA